MAEKIKIETVGDPRNWESDDGKIRLTFYTLTITKANGDKEEVDHPRKQGSSPPQPGEELEVEFEPGKYRPKMKKAKQAFSGGGSSGGKRDWIPETQRDPERSARILRQHSQEMSIRTLQMQYGSLKAEDKLQIEEFIKGWADWFDDDVIQAAKQGANESEGATSPVSPSPASRSAQAPGTSASVGDAHPGRHQEEQSLDAHHLDGELNNLGVTNGDDRRWLVQAWEALNQDKRKAAFASFTSGDLEAQNVALKRLWELAGPVPEYFRDQLEDIKF